MCDNCKALLANMKPGTEEALEKHRVEIEALAKKMVPDFAGIFYEGKAGDPQPDDYAIVLLASVLPYFMGRAVTENEALAYYSTLASHCHAIGHALAFRDHGHGDRIVISEPVETVH